MTFPHLHPAPTRRDVWLEQIRVAGLAIRWPALAATALLSLLTILFALGLVRTNAPLDFEPYLSMLPGMLGLVLPIAIWMGADRFGPSFFWTLPVDRRQHALAKIGAGWVWLMAAVAVLVLWQAAVTVLTGGSFLAEQTLRVVPSSSFAPPGTINPATMLIVEWQPHPLLWLVPFTAATGAYLLPSALALGTRRPLWWIAGALVALLLLDAASAMSRAAWLADAPQRVLDPLLYGRYSLDALFTARTESLKTQATLPGGEIVAVWRGVPDLWHWLIATFMWIGGGLLAVWIAASRHGESRPSMRG